MSEKKVSEYVTLVSCDGFEFIIRRSAACIAKTLNRMLDPANGFQESIENRCYLESISGVCLEKVCEYLYYHEKNKDARDVPDMEIPPEICLELLVAADFLDV
ncbi:uncharacterized protein PV09_09520 [Verruconis gallopava]|uniref:Elongin-C n=1 Tax=Verruconis gallopava TaxID=253628 RepID=A0A0D1ZW31_9PEZI|nr:uncharacterized protein PV09_09520 [Verruconis gallopava]KIV98692.1 hypothetical protein PV09_09520 [Verruconis gallopava]